MQSNSAKTLSVVIPNYNDAKYLRMQLQAVCEQSLPPDEVIVVDDASTDNSVEVINEFAAKFPFMRLVVNDENRGVIFSVNRGARMATGDYIHLSSANDLALPAFFEKSMALLAEYPEAGLCCADVRIIDEVQNITFDHLPTGWLPEPGYLSPEQLAEVTRRRKGLYAPVSNTCIIRRNLLPPDDIYIENLECFSDWFLYQVIAFRHGCCFIPEKLAAARVLPRSYGQSVLNDHNLCRRVLIEVLKLLASPEYSDVAPLLIRGRSLLVFRTFIRSPITAWKGSHGNPFFWHLSGEYFRQVAVRVSMLFGVSAWL
jgi:glycosyltransferase involved in cell wall biosynthesis